MALLKKINIKAKTDSNTGFGTNASNYGGRFVNKNGIPNVQKRGLSAFDHISWYHTLIDMPIWKFLIVLVTFYAGANFIFALLYYAIGTENLNGIDLSSSAWDQFGQAYFFSAQTYTTVGYGHISPSGFLASALSSVEALIGLLSFAIATGLLFGRFSKPTAFLKFSQNALIASYKDTTALMIRIVPFKNTNFTDAEAKMTLAMRVEEDGKMANKFYQLELEMEKINALTLNWTIVHPITEKSPLYQFAKEDFERLNGEILIYIKTFDDMFSTTVSARSSYTFDEVIYGANFELMYSENEDKTKTVLHIDKLDSYYKVELKHKPI